MSPDQLLKEISDFKINKVVIGFNELKIATPKTLNEFQKGFRVDEKGTSLIEKKNHHWKEEWYVIGDDFGDPIFVDLKDEKIYLATIGEEAPEPMLISNNVKEFYKIIERLKMLSAGRENPEKLDDNPISVEEIEEYEDFLAELEGELETWYWSGKIDE